MSFCTICKRGPLGPAFLAISLAVSTALASTDLQLDLSQPIAMTNYTAKLQALQRCETGTLRIAYSFGDLELAMGTACKVRVSIRGELGSDSKPRSFECDVSVLKRIDWLHDGKALRQNPPLQELVQQRTCSAT